jgi:hypothetical protein
MPVNMDEKIGFIEHVKYTSFILAFSIVVSIHVNNDVNINVDKHVKIPVNMSWFIDKPR